MNVPEALQYFFRHNCESILTKHRYSGVEYVIHSKDVRYLLDHPNNAVKGWYANRKKGRNADGHWLGLRNLSFLGPWAMPENNVPLGTK